MRSTCSGSTLWFAALVLLAAPFSFPGTSSAAAKPAAKAAAAKKHKPAAATPKAGGSEAPAKKDTPPAPYETPSPGPTGSPSSPPADSTGTSTSTDTSSSTSTSTSSSTSTSTETSTSTASSTDVEKEPAKPEEPRPLAESPAPPPHPAEPIPATVVTGGETPVVETPAPYVEHLGPKSFPGRLRGLYGGSLWLEPSFNGLQWPFMGRTGVGASGLFWVDSGYQTIIRNDKPNAMPGTKMSFQQGRGVLRLTPTYVHGRLFVQGQVELVGNMCQSTNEVCTTSGTFSTDDLWIRVGEWNKWDVKVGRFEAWEIYHTGMGLDLYTFERMGAMQYGVPVATKVPLDAPRFYGVNYMHDRPTEGLALGYAALHAYATEALRFELLAKIGTDNHLYSADDPNKPGNTYLGARPAFIYDVGWFKLKAGAEYLQRTAAMQIVNGSGEKQDSSYYRTRMGGGVALQFVLDPSIEFGVNAAYGRQRETDQNGTEIPQNSFTTLSLGGFANMRLGNLWLAGVGLNWTTQTDLYKDADSNSGTADYCAHLQSFLALQYLVSGQLFIKGVVGFARADFQPSQLNVAVWSNYDYSARIRMMYMY
jgi:hypothetical protein